MDILNVLEPLQENESITGYDYRNYFPYNMSQLGNSDEIRVACHNSTFAHLSKSCLYLEGSLESWSPEALQTVKLSKNFPLFLFSEVRLELNGQIVDSVRAPGIVGTIRNYCLMSEEEKSAATEYFWVDNVNEIAKTMPKFSCCVPLKTILGLCRDYQKIIVFSKLELVLVRSRNDLDCFAETTQSAKVNIALGKVAWKIPHVNLADLLKLRMSKILESGRELTLGFRATEYFENPNIGTNKQLTWQIKTSAGPEKPLYVIVGLQTDRKEKMDKDVTHFDHAGMRDAKLFLNSHQIPYESLDMDFESDQYSNAYHMLSQFRKSYLGVGSSYISSAQFKSVCPLLVFDATRMPVDIKSAPVDVRLEMNFNNDIPANTCAHVLLIYDKVVTYSPFSGVVLRQV